MSQKYSVVCEGTSVRVPRDFFVVLLAVAPCLVAEATSKANHIWVVASWKGGPGCAHGDLLLSIALIPNLWFGDHRWSARP